MGDDITRMMICHLLCACEVCRIHPCATNYSKYNVPRSIKKIGSVNYRSSTVQVLSSSFLSDHQPCKTVPCKGKLSTLKVSSYCLLALRNSTPANMRR